MTKILPFALVFLAALGFHYDTNAQEDDKWSNLKEVDFYFDEKSLNESTQCGNSSMTKKTEFNKNDGHESVYKPHSGGTHENISIWNLKRLIRYFASLLHSINGQNEYEDDLLHGQNFERVPDSKNATIKTNQTSTSPRIYKDADAEQFGDTEFENSGGGNDSEYSDEDKEGYGIKLLKPNTTVKPRVRNHGGISEDQQKNHMLPSEDLQSDTESEKHSSLLYEQVSREYIDYYINSPEEKELESDERPATNQKSTPFISDKPQNDKNCTLNITPFPAEPTSKIFKGNTDSPEEIKLPQSKNSTISNVKNDMHDRSPKNSSVLDDTESKNDTDIPTERHSDRYPKLEGNQNLEFFNASEKLKIHSDTDRDYDSSENSDSEEFYEYDNEEEEGDDDDDVQNMSNFAYYFTDTISNETTRPAENISVPYTNYSMEMKLPERSKNDSKINTPHKTGKKYNSILEFLYKYSNSTWIKKMKEENRRM